MLRRFAHLRKSDIAFIVIILLLVPFYHILSNINSIKLEPGKSTTIWVQSQNGNDDSALLNVKSASANRARLKYVVEKYAEIGTIVLPDVNTIFSRTNYGTKVRDIKTAPFSDGLRIIDHNKTSYMDGAIKYWKVVSREGGNGIRLAVFRYDKVTKQYQLINSSPLRSAQKGLNTFFEETPLSIKQNDILSVLTMKPISSNRVILTELAKVITQSGFESDSDKPKEVKDSGWKGSFSFSALLEAGKQEGEISVANDGPTVIKLPQNPVYGHVSWYKCTLSAEEGAFYVKPGLAAILLNADPYIGLIQAKNSPWTPVAFSVTFFILLSLLFACTGWLISPKSKVPHKVPIAIASILILFWLTRYFASSLQGLQFVAIVASFIMVFILPGVVISRFYSSYGNETASGRIILAFILSLVYWLFPAIGLFLLKNSYWPFILAASLLIVMIFLKQPVSQKREALTEELSPYWKTFQFALWGFVGLLVTHTLFSTRFHAELFDSFHHISLAAKNFELPVYGDMHTNLYGVTMRTMAPYAYNVWGLLVGMVMKISGFDIGTIYCVGNSLLVLLMFIAQWWLIGLFVDLKKIRILAFAIIIAIYVTRTLGDFAVVFQSTEFNFIMYGPSVHEFILYPVYIVLGVRAINSTRSADLFTYCGLSLIMASFHLQFVLLNTLVLFLLILLSLWVNGKLHFRRMHVYLLATIALLGTAGYIITSHLALGDITTSSDWHNFFYGLRYEDKTLLQRFYYIFKDLLKTINSYIWYVVAIWGGLLLVIFSSKKISVRLFNTTYLIIMLMLVFSYNPISDMVFTPLITNVPLIRVQLYLRAIMFTLAAIIISITFFNVTNFARKHVNNLNKILYAAPVVLLLVLLTHKQWLPQIKSTINTVTYNQGNFLDITYVANLPEVKYLNEYSKGKYINVLVEHPYKYVIPSITKTYSYYHNHYPPIDASITDRESVWEKCLRGEANCKSELPKNSIMLVRNEDATRFIKLGYTELYIGRLFTVLKV